MYCYFYIIFFSNSQFLLCEIDALNWSISQCGIFMEVALQKELVGYVPAAVKKWVLDKSRYT